MRPFSPLLLTTLSVLGAASCGGEATQTNSAKTDPAAPQGDPAPIPKTEVAPSAGNQGPAPVLQNDKPLCSGLIGASPDAPVLAALDATRTRLALGYADGHFTLSDPVFDDDGEIQRIAGFEDEPGLLLLDGPTTDLAGAVAVFDAERGVLVRSRLDDASRRDGGEAVAADGPSYVFTRSDTTMLLRSDGSWTSVDRATPTFASSVLRTNAWVALRPDNLSVFYDFETQQMRKTAVEPVDAPNANSALVRTFANGHFHYLASLESDQLALVIEGPEGANIVPLGFASDAQRSSLDLRDGFVIVRQDAALRAVVELQTGEFRVLDVPEEGVSDVLSAPWVLFVRETLPVRLLDVRSGEVRMFDSEGPPGANLIVGNGEWFLGTNAETPAWLLNVATGHLDVIDTDVGGAVPWPCTRDTTPFRGTRLYSDGFVGTVLQDATAAHFHLRNPEVGTWDQLGLGFTRVRDVAVQSVGKSFALIGRATTTDCTAADEIIAESQIPTLDEDGNVVIAPGLLLEDEGQIVLPGAPPLRYARDTDAITAHHSGLCLQVTANPGPRHLVDLAIGTRITLDLGWAVWL
jgi:hypothetical protein